MLELEAILFPLNLWCFLYADSLQLKHKSKTKFSLKYQNWWNPSGEDEFYCINALSYKCNSVESSFYFDVVLYFDLWYLIFSLFEQYYYKKLSIICYFAMSWPWILWRPAPNCILFFKAPNNGRLLLVC